ncbi:hypothetical protein QAD02_004765 [Eretmocerus hayati]|uniref:Uncharacterized protein n=1 Tax=Eretmocerus hayati TaxID=131215 RepID=A0ACC2NRN5_9HYME|nr:hypothetical protein QAD02_004765 [Eretmocerus hayati]
MENNNTLSNGGIHQQEPSPSGVQRFRSDRSKRAPKEIPAVETINWLLHRHYSRNEYEKCKALIEAELNKHNGRCEYPNYLKGLILRREGKVQDSLDCFQKSYSLNPTNVDNAKQIAKSLFLLGDHKRAIEVLQESLKISDDPDWEIHYYLGECYTIVNHLQDARVHLIRASELTKSESPYLALVKLCNKQDRVIESIAVYEQALRVLPESEEITMDLGLTYLGLGDTKRAFQQFGTALAQSSTNVAAILPMAYVMQSSGEFDVAFSKYRSAAQSMPESWSIWNNVGMCLYGKQKYVSAITCLRRAHYLNPLGQPAACNLAIVYLATGQPASAAVYSCAAVAASPDSHMPYLLLGLALRRLEDIDGAERALEKAHSIAPQDPQVLINYAIVVDAQSKVDRARELLADIGDVAAIVDVEPQITIAAKQLATKLRNDNESKSPSTSINHEHRILDEDEV